MANVTLSNGETEHGILPRVCCRCGKPADAEKNANFGWYPHWVLWLLLINVGVFGFVAMILRREKTVCLPVCADHNSFWKGPEIFVTISLVGAVIVPIGVADLMAGKPQRSDYFLATLLVCLVWGVFALIIGAVWRQRYIRITNMTDETISLKNLHADFVTALEADRDHDRTVSEARKLARIKWGLDEEPAADSSTDHTRDQPRYSIGERNPELRRNDDE